jgi:rfaE bifunctional protein nucleotidyltransferase chain/domain
MAVNASTESVKHQGTYILKKGDIEQTKVFTNGCFDIVHRGHIEMLRASKDIGDWLVVGLNTDRSIKRIKGNDRPVNNETDRKVLLESLDFVDEVILFDEDTPEQLIKNVKPDIITKGGDYTVDTVVGNELAEVVIIPSIKNYSTTNTIQRINNDTT